MHDVVTFGFKMKLRESALRQKAPRLTLPLLLIAVSTFGCFPLGIQSWGHGWSEQQLPLEGGKLIAFSTSQQRNNRTTQQWLCHVLLVYPDETARPTIIGHGTSSSGGDRPCFAVNWTFRHNGEWNTKSVELTYDLAAGKLNIEGQIIEVITDQHDKNLKVPTVVRRSTPGAQPFSLKSANLFVVRLGPQYDVTGVTQVDARIAQRATIADFKRLLPDRTDIQKITESAPNPSS